MDDNFRKVPIKISKKDIPLYFIVVAICISILAYAYWIHKLEVSSKGERQYRIYHATLRHNFKSQELTYKAYDTYLVSLLNLDEGDYRKSVNYLKASLGFLRVGYLHTDPFEKHAVPVIQNTISFLEERPFPHSPEDRSEIHACFDKLFRVLTQVEKELNIRVDELEATRQLAEVKARDFYKFLSFASAMILLLVSVMALRQRNLIKNYQQSQESLQSEKQDRLKAEQEKLRLVEELHQAKRMESLGLLAGGVAHDLNNILSGIVGYPELMLRKLPEDSELIKPLQAIHDSGRRAALVVC